MLHRQACQKLFKSLHRSSNTFSSQSETTYKKIFSQRKRCKRLSSLHKEYFVTSMIDVLLSQDRVQYAEPLLNRYRRDGHQFHVNVYNQLIDGWMKQNNNNKATLLYQSMLEDGVRPNYNTYAILLSHYSSFGKIKEGSELLEEMKRQGLTDVTQLPHYAKLPKNQMTSLLKLLKELGVTVSAPIAKEDKDSYPPLVQSIYSNNTTKEVTTKEDNSLEYSMFDSHTIQNRIQSQMDIEKNGYEKIQSIAKPVGKVKEREKVSVIITELYSKWEEELTAAIEEELSLYESCLKTIDEDWLSHSYVPKHVPFLASLSPSVWAKIVKEEVLMKVVRQSEGQPLLYLCRSIISSAWRRYVIEQKEKRGITEQMLNVYQSYITSTLSSSHERNTFSRQFWREIQDNQYYNGTMDTNIHLWPQSVGIHVGSALIDIVLEKIKLPDELIKRNIEEEEEEEESKSDSTSAFDHTYQHLKGEKRGYLKPHPSLYSLFEQLHSKAEALSFYMDCAELPMLVPPQPWSNVNEGGYLLTPSSIVRCHSDSYQHQLLLEATDDMSPVLDSLNYLSTYPWKVNTKMLDLLIDLYNNGGDESLGVLPTDLPEIPSIPKNCDEELRKSIIHERKAIKKLHNKNFSLRMELLYKLSMNNHYRDTLFWLPHNLDFKSRVYPIPPHITYHSNDLSRSLIQFGLGHPLGKRGLEWLKIHLANLHGAKSKGSLQERLEFTDGLIDQIMDSADNPFEGNCWWKTSDKPWQTLACCMDLTAALRSGDPENYCSHTPVYQDGSCNGLQHYAAMGRDVYGAKQVNLMPSDIPADLYAEVALLVDKRRKVDADNGDELAKQLEGKVHRKVVKKTVMTVPYGVTLAGGRFYIENQLQGTIPDELLFEASSYLVGLVFDSLKEMLSNARQIQDWLASSARMIALAGFPVEWVMPLGMPLVQSYHKPVTKQHHFKRLQDVTQINNGDLSRPPNSAKQENAMSANFIHSLDSTHMMLTALHCQKAGVPFVAVHDSYWTHGAFVDEMNKICREQFIALHSEPIIGDLASFFEEKFGGLLYHDYGTKLTRRGKKICSFKNELPSQGELQLDHVRNSTYFFS